MARRAIRTDRLIAVLGVAVVVLGALALWFITRGSGGGFTEEPASQRVLRQLRERDPRLQAFQIVPGATDGVLCGFAGVPTGRPSVEGEETAAGGTFISRRNRISFESDPLPKEFAQDYAEECAELPRGPTAYAVQ